MSHGCPSRRRRGSVLILVVALLAVLFVTGMGFLSMTSIDRISSRAAERNAALAIETDSIVDRIVSELSRDLWGDDNRILSGNGANEEWDYPCSNNASSGSDFGRLDDAWLASILPDTAGSGVYAWPHVSNLTGVAGFGRNASDTGVLSTDLEADADMDGINDSRWVLSPTGRYRYAVRVIDLNGMINLNTAGRGFPDDVGNTPYHVAASYSNMEQWWDHYAHGDFRMLVNIGGGSHGYFSYGRGAPGTTGSNDGRNTQNDFAFMLDNQFLRTTGRYPDANPFRTSDTIALMAYGIKPGPVASRIAVAWGPNTGTYTSSVTFSTDRNQMPNPRENSPNPLLHRYSFNLYYTTYGWTRKIRSQVAPSGTAPTAPGISSWDGWRGLLNAYDSTGMGKVNVNHKDPHDPIWTRAVVAAIVLGGAMQGNGGGLTQRQVEQLVVNLADFRDSDLDISKAGANPGGDKGLVDTVFNSSGIYGIEPSVFINEVGAYQAAAKPDETSYAVEFTNPYKTTVNMTGWQIRTAGGTVTLPNNTRALAGRQVVVRSSATRPIGGAWANASGVVLDPALKFGDGGSDIRLIRPQNADGSGDMVIVDMLNVANVRAAVPNWCVSGGNGLQHAVRGDTEWMQARDVWFSTSTQTWGKANGLIDPDPAAPTDPNKDRFYIPWRNGRQAAIVAPFRGAEFDTVGQLHWMMLVGPEDAGGKPVTTYISEALTGDATSNLYLNFGNTSRGDARALTNLVCLDRRANGKDDNGNGEVDDLTELRMPGLININTATPHVMRYINYYMCPSEASWHPQHGDSWQVLSYAKLPYEYFDFNQHIYAYREANKGFRSGIAEVMNVPKMTQTENLFDQLVFPRTIPGMSGNKGTYLDSARNRRAELINFFSLNPALDSSGNPVVKPWFHDQAAHRDLNEKMFIFDRISDLITTRSDTFLAYVLVQLIDRRGGANYWSPNPSDVRVIQQRRMVVILDRSRCNYPPTDVRYVAPEVVARSVTTW